MEISPGDWIKYGSNEIGLAARAVREGEPTPDQLKLLKSWVVARKIAGYVTVHTQAILERYERPPLMTPVREITSRPKPLCEAKLKGYTTDTMTHERARREAYRRHKGVPVDQCGKPADLLVGSTPMCRAHAGQALVKEHLKATKL